MAMHVNSFSPASLDIQAAAIIFRFANSLVQCLCIAVKGEPQVRLFFFFINLTQAC